MSYDIEMLWECSTCHHRGNRGLKDRYCCNCGHKKDASDPEYMPDDMSEAAALSGDEAARAAAGTDRICKYCDSVQSRLNKHCGNCGADDMGTRSVEPSAVEYPTESRLEALAEETRPSAPSEERFAHRFWAAVIGVSALAAALVAFFVVPHEVSARVSALHWQHDTIIERYAVYPHEGFDPSFGSFEVLPMGLRHHHYDHVHVGSHQESYRESYACGESCTTSPSYTTCSSNGNGTARCTKHDGGRSCTTKYCSRTAYRTVQDYRDVSRSQIWYSWKIWEWGYNRTVTRSGSSTETFWPSEAELSPGRIAEGEKERSSRQASYKVTFRNVKDPDSYTIEPKTLADFQHYSQGQLVKLKVNRAGSVEVLP